MIDFEKLPKGVWNDALIHEWAKDYVTPYNPARVESGSLDLTLSNMIRLPNPFWTENYDFILRQCHYSKWNSYSAYVDEMEAALSRHPVWSDPVEFDRRILLPGEFVLLSSLEVMELLPCMTGLLVLKSTPGRVGLNHSHSGHGDPGFGHGKPSSWTFEIKNIGHAPYVLKAGSSIVQLVISTMADLPMVSYADKGENYNGQIVPTVARV